MHSKKQNILVIQFLVLLCFVASETSAKGDGWQQPGGVNQKGAGGAPLGGWDDEVMGNPLGESIPGIAGRSYPNHDKIPDTGFDCRAQKDPGYYGDTEAQCQVFHVCQEGGRRNSFLCPLGTLFNQETFVCDWWFNVNCGETPDHYARNAHLHRGPDVGIDGQKVGRQPGTAAKGGPGTDHQVGIPTWGPPGEGNRNPRRGTNRRAGDDSSWGDRGTQGEGGRSSVGASPGNRGLGGDNSGNAWMNNQRNGGRRQRGQVGGMGGGNGHFPQNGNALVPNQKGGGERGFMGGGNGYIPQNEMGGNAHAPNQKGGAEGRPMGGNAAGPPNQRRGRRNGDGNADVQPNRGIQNRDGPPGSWMNNQRNGGRRQRGQVGGMGGGNAHFPQNGNALVPYQKGGSKRGQGQLGQRGGGQGTDVRPNAGRGWNDQGSRQNEKGLQGMNGGNEGLEGENAFSPNHRGGGRKGHPRRRQHGNEGWDNGIRSNEGSGNANLPGNSDFSLNHRGGQKGQQQTGGNNRNGPYPNQGPVAGNVNFQGRNDFSTNPQGSHQGRNDGGRQENNKGSKTVSFQANRWSMDSRHFRHASNHQKGDGNGNQGPPSFDGIQDLERPFGQSSGNVVEDGTGFGNSERTGEGDFAYDYPEGNSRQFEEQRSYEGQTDYNDYSYAWNS